MPTVMPAELVREPGPGRFGVDLVEPRSREGVDGQVVHNESPSKKRFGQTDLGASGSVVGAAAVLRPSVVDEAPLVAVRAVGDVFAL